MTSTEDVCHRKFIFFIPYDLPIFPSSLPCVGRRFVVQKSGSCPGMECGGERGGRQTAHTFVTNLAVVECRTGMVRVGSDHLEGCQCPVFPREICRQAANLCGRSACTTRRDGVALG
jgi:hypothetical protein